MGYHKSIKITRPEAHYIINTCARSLSELVVVSHHQLWYDVRSLTTKEIDDFYSDLMRADLVRPQAHALLAAVQGLQLVGITFQLAPGPESLRPI